MICPRTRLSFQPHHETAMATYQLHQAVQKVKFEVSKDDRAEFAFRDGRPGVSTIELSIPSHVPSSGVGLQKTWRLLSTAS